MDALRLKSFLVHRGRPGGSGFSVHMVRAPSEAEAKEEYREHLRMACFPVATTIKELPETQAVTEIFEWDNPNYEG